MPPYSLRGDRHVEYTFATDHIPLLLPGEYGAKLLDVGPGPRCSLGRHALKMGWEVCAVDILEEKDIPGILWIKSDLNDLEFDNDYFRLILNVSSIEHFGIPGRYGIDELDDHADLNAMLRMRDWLHPEGRMIVTLPVGKTGNPSLTLMPFHRVYGNERLKWLFKGYRVIVQKFWCKKGNNDEEFVPCSDVDAFSTRPTINPSHYYAIAGFVLAKDGS